MASIFSVPVSTLNAAAKKRGFTREAYVSRLASISTGREVCAHLAFIKDGTATFILSESVRTS